MGFDLLRFIDRYAALRDAHPPRDDDDVRALVRHSGGRCGEPETSPGGVTYLPVLDDADKVADLIYLAG